MENRKLSRNTMNKVIGGVCSGLAEYFGLDTALVRIAFVIAFMFASFGFWIYIILCAILPVSGQQTIDNGQPSESVSESEPVSKSESKVKSIFAGSFVILVGLLFLVNNFIPINWVWKLWPLILVAIGVVMIITSRKK